MAFEATWGTFVAVHPRFREVSSSREAKDLCAEVEASAGDDRILIMFSGRDGHSFSVGVGARTPVRRD